MHLISLLAFIFDYLRKMAIYRIDLGITLLLTSLISLIIFRKSKNLKTGKISALTSLHFVF